MKKFLKDLERELKMLKMSNEDIVEILEDHKEMIEEATSDGLDEKQIEEKFGNPKIVAKDIFDDTQNTNNKLEINLNKVDSCVKENTDTYDLVEGFPVVSSEISVEIGLVSDDLSITTYDGESIQVYQRGIEKLGEYEISFEKDIFILKKKKTTIKFFNFSKKNAYFLVLIPENLEIGNFYYKTVSGDAKLNGIISKDYKIKTTSGDLQITNQKSDDIKISTVSGDLEIATMEAASFEISLVSGDLEIKKAKVDGTMYFNSVSGDIDLEDIECSEATLKTVSGDMKGKEFYPNQISLKSVSGDIEIINSDKNREIVVAAKKTVSGEINFR